MLTVKAISGDYEKVRQAKSVLWHEKSGELFVFWDGEDTETFTEGQFYVMNENGKTVADYFLAPPSVGNVSK